MRTILGLLALSMIAAADPPPPKRVTTDLCRIEVGYGATVSLKLVESGKDKFPEIYMTDKHAVRTVDGWLTLDQAKQIRDCLDEAIRKSNVK